ncbi:MAG: hypothetical protein FVQ84_04320 [Planctomycetes bacterium]|nr:hypothetical protein [Planctomycetota bacterium]
MKYERMNKSKVLFAAKIGLLAVGLVWLGHTAYVAQATLCYTMDSQECEEAQYDCPSETPCDNDWFSEPEHIDRPIISSTGYYNFGIVECEQVLCVTWYQCVLLESGYCGPDPGSRTEVWQDPYVGINSGCVM